MKSMISCHHGRFGLVGSTLMTIISERRAACFSTLGKFLNSRVLSEGQGDNCCLIFEKQIDVLDGPEASHL